MIQAGPLVSVICLSYNHERFIEEALRSVLDQTYKNIEIIVVDDASTDKSLDVIEKLANQFPKIRSIVHTSNQGNCISFNQALKVSTGQYIVDFATDDVILSDRIEKQVAAFEKLDKKYGVVYTDAVLIDEQSLETGSHYGLSLFSNFIPPSGNVYKTILEKYFINPPTMMFRRALIEKLGGYDESLAYEDFDFWVRSSRECEYFYLNEKLTKRRIVAGSHSDKFKSRFYAQMFESTYQVCLKALWLNRNEEENDALATRIQYEMTQAFFKKQKGLVEKYFSLLKNMKKISFRAYVLRMLILMK